MLVNNYKYSVLMSLYKKEKPEYLRLALDSMLNQTVKPDEIVLVEDGPLTAELYGVLDEYEKKCNLRRIKNKTNLGLGLALNRGLKACKNELIARMDTDDIAVLDRCEQQLAYFEKDASLDILGGDIAEFIDDINNIVGNRIVPINDHDIKEYMKKRCAFNHMTVMYKKSAVLNAGNYFDWFWNEDYYLWIRMLIKDFRMANTGTTLVNVRVGSDMYKRRGGLKYFKSEKKLQEYMLKRKVINLPTFIINVLKRFIIEVVLPNSVRGWVFQKFARK